MTPRRHHRATTRRASRLLKLAQLLVRRVWMPVALLLAVFVLGTFGYYVIGIVEGRAWSILDCAFMTSITLSTVGYGDVLGIEHNPIGRVYTMLLIVSGLGTTLYSVSALTAFIVEGHLGRLFEEERMEAQIDALDRHTIICGAGRTGSIVAEEHEEEGRPFVIIDKDPMRFHAHGGEDRRTRLTLVGDATSEEVLDRAGIQRAGALVAALSDDKANMFLVVTARYRRKDLRLVAKCLDHDAAGKFLAAGADHVVSPGLIGGRRIAGHVLRPGVLDFLDSILRRSEVGVGAVEVVIAPGSALVGCSLAEANLSERVGLPIVALRHPEERRFVYAPNLREVLRAGTTLVVIGPADRTQKLEAIAAS